MRLFLGVVRTSSQDRYADPESPAMDWQRITLDSLTRACTQRELDEAVALQGYLSDTVKVT